MEKQAPYHGDVLWIFAKLEYVKEHSNSEGDHQTRSMCDMSKIP